jgi:hypothetical protein
MRGLRFSDFGLRATRAVTSGDLVTVGSEIGNLLAAILAALVPDEDRDSTQAAPKTIPPLLPAMPMLVASSADAAAGHGAAADDEEDNEEDDKDKDKDKGKNLDDATSRATDHAPAASASAAAGPTAPGGGVPTGPSAETGPSNTAMAGESADETLVVAGQLSQAAFNGAAVAGGAAASAASDVKDSAQSAAAQASDAAQAAAEAARDAVDDIGVSLPTVSSLSLETPSFQFMDYIGIGAWVERLTPDFGRPSFRFGVPDRPKLEFPSFDALLASPTFPQLLPEGMQFNVPGAPTLNADGLLEAAERASQYVDARTREALHALGSFFLVKFDIIRDFFQFLSLFFTEFTLPPSFKRFFGNLSGIISLDIDFVIPKISPALVFWIVFVLTMVLFAVAVMRGRRDPDHLRHGHETRSWGKRKKKDRIITQAVLTVLLTLYLPVSRNALQMLSCHSSILDVVDACWKGSHFLYIAASAATVAAVTLYTPYHVFRVVQRNKPRDARFDADGAPITEQEQNREYVRRLNLDRCPYKFLYDGYERPWAFYKVIVMVLKLAVIAPIVILEDKELTKVLLALGVLMGFSGLSLASGPFINSGDDRMDNSSRITNMLTAAASIIVLEKPSTDSGIGIFLNILNTLNLLVIVFYAATSFPSCKRAWKRITRRIDWTEDREWDLRLARKHRVWWSHWKLILYIDDTLADSRARLVESEHVVHEYGVDRYMDELRPVPQTEMAARLYCFDHLEGTDCYWDGVPLDGHLDSATHFGKLWLRVFPFEATFVWDDCDDAAKLTREEVVRLVGLNTTQEVIRRRHLRHAFRALSGNAVAFPHSEWKNKTIREGHGDKSRSRTIRVLFHFQSGMARVDANSDLPMSAGFTFAIHYSDGVGSAEGHNFSGESTTVGSAVLGFGPNFMFTPALHQLFALNNTILASRFPVVHEAFREYRASLHAQRVKQRNDLSWAFWALVFNNDMIPRAALDEYLIVHENQRSLESAPSTHAQLFDFAYRKLAFFDTSPMHATWYTFWEDLWSNNQEHGAIREAVGLLSPDVPTSIALSPRPRAEVEALLEQHELTKLVRPRDLDFLYGRLDKLCAAGGAECDYIRDMDNIPATLPALEGGEKEVK